MFGREGSSREPRRQHQPAGDAEARADEVAAARMVEI
jgi:hypothetical protein